MNFIDKITPPHIRELVPYASARRELHGLVTNKQAIWLNANENPYRGGADSSIEDHMNRYPNAQSDPLLASYSEYADIDPDSILVTRGADEGIELLVRTFCIPQQDKIIINTPTYGMYKICADTHHVATQVLALLPNWQLDIQQLIAAKQPQLKLVFICSPNNPTGNLLSRPDIIAVLDAYQDNSLVVVDEAYIEFCPAASVQDLLHRYPNLVILRTLSKAFGLAGIRCGFTLAHPDVINMLKKVIAPYPLPTPVEQQALSAMSSQGIEHMRQQVSLLNLQKHQTVEALNQLNLVKKIHHSDSNFVLFQVDNKQKVMDTLLEHHIYLRDQSKQPRLVDHLRISIGDEEQMQQTLRILEELDS